MSTSSFTFVSLVAAVLFVIRSYDKPKRKLPPGPPGLPLIGNLLQLLGVELRWLTFISWSQKYGPLFSLNLGGKPAIVIGNHKVAIDLLEKRANIYSDRPANIVAAQIMTRGLVYALGSHNNTWRRMRKASHEVLNNHVAKNYHHFQNTEATLLVYNLFKTPESYVRHIQRATASSFLSILYGLPPCLDPFDPALVSINDITRNVLNAAAPGQYLVEYFPFLRYLPTRLLRWKQHAEGVYLTADSLFHDLYQQVEKRLEAGDMEQCVTASLIQDPVHKDLPIKERAWLAGTLYAAGSETTSKQILWFLLSMAIYPDIQQKAQTELDKVVGRERLPNFDDFGKLPYVQAVVRELLRWRGVAPFGVPHASCEDDIYEGYFIPKGTDCIVNVWALNNDVDVYGSDASSFRPERHLDEHGQIQIIARRETKDESHTTFGFGKRICVGRHVALNNIFIQIASILWCFTISPGTDEVGKPVRSDENSMLDDGLTIQPLLTNKYHIVPRFSEGREVVRNAIELNGLNIVQYEIHDGRAISNIA